METSILLYLKTKFGLNSKKKIGLWDKVGSTFVVPSAPVDRFAVFVPERDVHVLLASHPDRIGRERRADRHERPLVFGQRVAVHWHYDACSLVVR